MAKAARPVLLFGSPIGPYGDARLNRPGAYHKTMHGVVEEDGFMPFFAGTQVDFSSVAAWSPPVEWENNVTSGYSAVGPTLSSSGGTAVLSEQVVKPAGTVTQATIAASNGLAEQYNSIAQALHSNGGSTPRLFRAKATGTALSRPNNSATWANMSGTPSSSINGFYSENGNLWAVLSNGYQVRKWPAGTDPTTATAGAAIDVGTSAWAITAAGLLGGSRLMWIKPDGFYVYDLDRQEFYNIYAGLTTNPHPDTGKGTLTWGANVLVPLGDHGLVMVTPDLNTIPISPLPAGQARFSFDTPGVNKLGALAGDDQYVYAATEPFQRRLGSEITLKVFTTDDDGSSFNDRTSVCTDDDPSTTLDFTDFSSVTTLGAIYIGGVADRFSAPWIALGTFLITNTDFTMQYWDGSSWTDVPNVTDYTARFTRSGPWLPAAKMPADWAITTVNSVEGYWVRLSITASLDTSEDNTTISEIRVLPEGSALPQAATTEAEEEEAGLRTHILRGYAAPEGFVWHDVASIRGDYSRGLIFSRVKGSGGRRQFYAFGPPGFVRFGVGATASPSTESYPNCVNSFPSLLYLPADDRIENATRAPNVKKGLEYLEVQGRNFNESDDVLYAWVRMDGGNWHYYSSGKQLPNRLVLQPRADVAVGYEYEVIIGLEDSTQDERVPIATRVIAGVFDAEGTPISD